MAGLYYMKKDKYTTYHRLKRFNRWLPECPYGKGLIIFRAYSKEYDWLEVPVYKATKSLQEDIDECITAHRKDSGIKNQKLDCYYNEWNCKINGKLRAVATIAKNHKSYQPI